MNLPKFCTYLGKRGFAAFIKEKRSQLQCQSVSQKLSNCRKFGGNPNMQKEYPDRIAGARSTRNKVVAATLAAGALAYAAVPLYRIFCQKTGYGGTVKTDVSGAKVENLVKVSDREIKIKFISDVHSSLTWNFKPQQHEITVFPGETALAFYTAFNPTDKPVIGVSTYNVLPFEAGPYFNKIQCFCFEEQQLNPREEVDLPVFFYVDPEFATDPKMEEVDEILLSYTFFAAKQGHTFTLPTFVAKNNTEAVA